MTVGWSTGLYQTIIMDSYFKNIVNIKAKLMRLLEWMVDIERGRGSWNWFPGASIHVLAQKREIIQEHWNNLYV